MREVKIISNDPYNREGSGINGRFIQTQTEGLSS